MNHDDQDRFWLMRVDATGKAQARYLWLILVAGLFFAALHTRLPSSTTIEVPVVRLPLDSTIVLASGGPILAFLILAAIGAIRAWTNAIHPIQAHRPEITAEALDSHPNAIDLAVYTTDHTPKIIRDIVYFAYPLFLLAALVEAAWLGATAWTVLRSLGRGLLTGFFAVTWIPAAIMVLYMWTKRIQRTFKKRGAA